MVPRKKKPEHQNTPKANPQTEAEAEAAEENEDHQTITVSHKDTSAKFQMYGRAGSILIYAIAYAIVVGTTGLVIFQIIKALQLTGAKLPDSMGLILWLSTTLICACFSLYRA